MLAGWRWDLKGYLLSQSGVIVPWVVLGCTTASRLSSVCSVTVRGSFVCMCCLHVTSIHAQVMGRVMGVWHCAL